MMFAMSTKAAGPFPPGGISVHAGGSWLAPSISTPNWSCSAVTTGRSSAPLTRIRANTSTSLAGARITRMPVGSGPGQSGPTTTKLPARVPLVRRPAMAKLFVATSIKARE
ncbi:hypothetical protein D9M70_544990 [compost metagenome]